MHKPKTNGFINILLLVGIAAALVLAGFAYKKSEDAKFGASLQTQLTDTLGTFRTNVNTSLTTLDTNVATVTSTLNGYGNIVTQNTPLAASAGGTGTSTTPTGTFLGNNGGVPQWKALIIGNGLLSTTTASSVQLGSTGFDNTANITFSGNNTHNGLETFASTTKFNASTSFNATTTFTANLLGAQFIPLLAAGTVTSTNNFSTGTSGVFVTIGSSTANGIASTTISLTGTHRVFLTLTGSGISPSAGNDLSFDFSVDGTRTSNAARGMQTLYQVSAVSEGAISLSYVTSPLTTGSHTFRALMETGGSGAGTFGDVPGTTGVMWAFNAVELYN